MRSLYIHIPFCVKKCIYCDFCSVNYTKNIAEVYVDALCGQIRKLDKDFYTIYIGGGTPTILDFRLIKQLLNELRVISKRAIEFTVEANPDSMTRDKIKLFQELGVNRISIGVQSLNNTKLSKLGRLHSAEKAFSSVYLAREEGFKNINIDLIFGVWQETMAEWKKDLGDAVKLPVTHISSYSLTYEKRTPLSKLLKKRKVVQIDDSLAAKMYEHTMNFLPKHNFLQYEISNFAKKGFECKHNCSYWKNEPYVGLGVSAVSYCEGQRMRNTSDIQKYISALKHAKSPVIYREKLSAKKSAKELAAIKIRTSEGINLGWFRQKTGFDFFDLEKNALSSLVSQKLLTCRKAGIKEAAICLTKKGFLFCDSVSTQLL